MIKLDDELSVLKNHTKTIHENSELANQISNLNKINDKLEISNQSLTKSLHDTKQSYQSEILALNARIENLNDENDQLHLRLAGEDTTNSSRVKTSKEATLPSMDETTESDDDTTEFDSILKELQPCDMPESNPSNPQLEIDTLRSTLQHSNRTIA